MSALIKTPLKPIWISYSFSVLSGSFIRVEINPSGCQGCLIWRHASNCSEFFILSFAVISNAIFNVNAPRDTYTATV